MNNKSAYIIENGLVIREVTIIKQSGNFVTVKLLHSGGAINIRKNRIFYSYEDAENHLPKKITKHNRITHYDYESMIGL